jgi:putative transposase
MPYVNTTAMNFFLETFAKMLAPNAHAVMLLDRAGWHRSNTLRVPSNVTLMYLPPKSPQLNPSEWPWRECRQKYLANRILRTDEDIYAAVGDAWNKLTSNPKTIQSLCGFDWILSALRK